MRYRIIGRAGQRQAVIKLEPGDEVIGSLLQFCRGKKIRSGTVSALGAVGEATLGWFDDHKCVYTKKTLREPLEVVGLTGNIAWLGKDPILHCHAIVSGRDFKPVSGHLFSGVVSVTVECSLIEFGMKMERARDPRFCLNLMRL